MSKLVLKISIPRKLLKHPESTGKTSQRIIRKKSGQFNGGLLRQRPEGKKRPGCQEPDVKKTTPKIREREKRQVK